MSAAVRPLPPKSAKLKEDEADASASVQAVADFMATIDKSGAEILRPELRRQQVADSQRLFRDRDEKTRRASDHGREESWERADKLLKMHEFRAAMEAHIKARSQQLEATAHLLLYMDDAGRDAIAIHQKVFVVTPDDVKALKMFAAGVRLQKIDLALLTPAVREWMQYA